MPDMKELMGKMVSDPLLEETRFGTKVCSFRIACDYELFTRNGRPVVVFADCFAVERVAEFVYDRFCKDMPIILSQSMNVRKVEEWNGEHLFLLDIEKEFERFVGSKIELSEKQIDAIPALLYEKDYWAEEDQEDESHLKDGTCEIHFAPHAYDLAKKNRNVIVEPSLFLGIEEGCISYVEPGCIVEPWDDKRDGKADNYWSDVDIQTALEYLGILTGKLILNKKSEMDAESSSDDEKSISISELARRLTSSGVVNSSVKLKYCDIADWLFENGYLIYSWHEGKKSVQPTKKGSLIGINNTQRTSPDGTRYIALLLGEDAQKTVKDNIEAILQRKKRKGDDR